MIATVSKRFVNTQGADPIRLTRGQTVELEPLPDHSHYLVTPLEPNSFGDAIKEGMVTEFEAGAWFVWRDFRAEAEKGATQ